MNLHTKKRTCNRCRAGDKFCELGYESEWTYYEEIPLFAFGKPLEPCPKPVTYSNYLYALKWYNKK